MKEIRLSLKYRLYENKHNVKLHQTIDCSGIAWNHILALQNRYYVLTGKYAHKYVIQKHMAKLRKQSSRFSYLKNIGSQALQDISERQDKAFQAFFKWTKSKSGVKKSPPKFQKVKKYKSFTLKQVGWKYEGSNKIKLHGVVYKFVLSRPVDGEIKTITIKRDKLGGLWIVFSVVQMMAKVKTDSGKSGGFDFGLKTFLTDNTGKQYKNPQFLKQDLNKLARLNRNLSRKVKYSNNWYKTKKELTKCHNDISNKRKDYHFKLAKELATEFDVLCFEDLNITGMKKLWGRKVSDLGFYSYLKIQEHMCNKHGSEIVKISRWEATTSICSECGTKYNMSLSDRVFNCDNCGLSLDRDHNAAINILSKGICSWGRDSKTTSVASLV